MAKISNFIISIVLCGLVITVLSGMMATLSTNYNTVDFDNTSLDVYNKIDLINDDLDSITNKTTAIKEKTGVLDVLNSMFSDAFSTLLLALNSFNLFNSMADRAFEDLHLGIYTGLFKTAIILIVLIVIIIGIFISTLIKRDV